MMKYTNKVYKVIRRKIASVQLAIWLVVHICCSAISAFQIIRFDDVRINKYGRYVDDSVGTNLTWSGSALQFKVQNTTQIQLNLQVNTDTGAAAEFECFIDNDTSCNIAFVSTPHDNQEQMLTIFDELTPDEHSVVIKRGEFIRHSSLAGSEFIKIRSVIIDDSAVLRPDIQAGTYAMLFLGDSWAGGCNTITRFMNKDLWNIWSVGFGGFKSSSMLEYYPYKSYSAVHSDPPQTICAIQFGVNDYNAAVSENAFKINIQSLMDLVAVDHPGIEFFLIQVPRNLNANRNYDLYGGVLYQLTLENQRTHYISTESIWSQLTWSDNNHIDLVSRKMVYAPFLDTQIAAALSTTGTVENKGNGVSRNNAGVERGEWMSSRSNMVFYDLSGRVIFKQHTTLSHSNKKGDSLRSSGVEVIQMTRGKYRPEYKIAIPVRRE